MSELLYAYTSATGNSGSAFAGLNANTPFWNLTLGLAMLAGRFLMMVPVLALGGSMLGKKVVNPGPGTFPTGTLLFCGLLVGVILILGALTFFRRSRSAHRRRLRRPRRQGALMPATNLQARSLFDAAIIGPALLASLRKLAPQEVLRNPVMFVVEVGSAHAGSVRAQLLASRSLRAWRTRLQKGARSLRWPKSATACAALRPARASSFLFLPRRA